NARNAITIGAGERSSLNNFLVNNTDNSLFIGFNSNIPTLVVTPSAGINTTGNVGIGTSNPTSKLDVSGDIQSSSLVGSGFNLLQSNATGKISKVLPSTDP